MNFSGTGPMPYSAAAETTILQENLLLCSFSYLRVFYDRMLFAPHYNPASSLKTRAPALRGAKQFSEGSVTAVYLVRARIFSTRKDDARIFNTSGAVHLFFPRPQRLEIIPSKVRRCYIGRFAAAVVCASILQSGRLWISVRCAEVGRENGCRLHVWSAVQGRANHRESAAGV